MITMRTRNHRFVFYLNDKEFEDLDKQVKRTRLSREQFCRNAIQGVTIREKPPADVPRLIQEIRRVGSNISQILMLANSQGLLNIPDLHKAILDLREVEKLIVYQYTK